MNPVLIGDINPKIFDTQYDTDETKKQINLFLDRNVARYLRVTKGESTEAGWIKWKKKYNEKLVVMKFKRCNPIMVWEDLSSESRLRVIYGNHRKYIEVRRLNNKVKGYQQEFLQAKADKRIEARDESRVEFNNVMESSVHDKAMTRHYIRLGLAVNTGVVPVQVLKLAKDLYVSELEKLVPLSQVQVKELRDFNASMKYASYYAIVNGVTTVEDWADIYKLSIEEAEQAIADLAEYCTADQ